ncbi:MAG: hypothetical protein LBU97_05465 [Alistipes sp.]|jgi:hypothetical protein|nr:hypothetical protein [Alistipes sp.]
MKKYIFIVAAILGAGALQAQTPAQAQTQTDGDISKQLEVTRAYTPHVGQAAKLAIEPDMTDTVRLRPEVSYSITSTASATSFSTRPFEAATVGAAPLGASGPLYIRAGVGAPFATALDLYFSPRTRTGSTFGLFANHRGSFSRIVNDIGAKAGATEMTNGAGVWGSRQWKRYSLEGNITYDARRYDPYGAAPNHGLTLGAIPYISNFDYDGATDRIKLGAARGGVSFGDNFADLSRFNFRVGVDAGFAHAGTNGRYRPQAGNRQVDFDAHFTAAQMLGDGRHGFEVMVTEQMTRDVTAYDWSESDRNTLVIGFSPRYLLRDGDLRLKLGFDVRYIINKKFTQTGGVYAPVFEVSYNPVSGAFVPFVSLSSYTEDGDIESLSRRNPYVTESGKIGWINDLRVGFSGDLGDVLSYRIAGGASYLRDHQVFVGEQIVSLNGMEITYTPMRFFPMGIDGTRFTMGAEVGLHNLGGFGARLHGEWNRYQFRPVADMWVKPVGDLPKYRAGLELSYSHREVFSIRAGAELIGERDYLVQIRPNMTIGFPPPPRSYTLPSAVDLSLAAEVRVSPDFWVWVEGTNLAGQKLYPFPHYPGLGAGVMGGVKIVF